jgi:hypothetical protein
MELAQQMLNLRDGDHLCLFYDKNPAEQMPALVPFIHDALTKDEGLSISPMTRRSMN